MDIVRVFGSNCICQQKPDNEMKVLRLKKS